MAFGDGAISQFAHLYGDNDYEHTFPEDEEPQVRVVDDQKFCSHKNCDQHFTMERWSSTKAHSAGWFMQKYGVA